MPIVSVDAAQTIGPLDLHRHSLGHGGINWLPLPDRVVEGVAALRPRLIRIFLQEFFRIYPEHGRFDWSRLDPYMAGFARTGAKIVAAITIKPPPLYPKIDQAIWQPTDWKEWQHVIVQLVRRYSVEQPLVTHWEVGNEVDIGEHGGCPYLIRDGDAYGEYYSRTVEAVLQAFPQAKVGGPAMASLHDDPLPGFLKYVRRTGARLDFLSWHLYHSDPSRHAYLGQVAGVLCRELLGRRPEFFVTEWNRDLFPLPTSTEDAAYDARRSAAVAASILAMRRARIDWSFYYHIWDQICFPADFEPFFSEAGVAGMVRHWNEIPHRLGLFAVNGQVRPQYFLYRMFAQMNGEELATSADPRHARVLAGRDERGTVHVLAVNYSLDERIDRTITLRLANLESGPRRITVYRIDSQQRGSPETLEMCPVEVRDTWAPRQFQFDIRLPADSVALVRFEPIP